MTMANIHKGMISDFHMLVVVKSCLIGPKDHSKGGKSCFIIKNLAIFLRLMRTQTLQKINYLCVFLKFITNGWFEFPCFFSKGPFLVLGLSATSALPHAYLSYSPPLIICEPAYPWVVILKTNKLSVSLASKSIFILKEKEAYWN